MVSGSVTWGHLTGVQEDNALPFLGNWDGTGVIEGVNDAERIGLDVSQYMSSGVVETSLRTVELLTNNYGSGDSVAIKYRHGATVVACEAAAWTDYTVPFESLGYVQVRIEPLPGHLLLETGGFLLLETGDKLLFE